jgi:endonuclease/exonuclease/phosphatase (EEP) superfamily protein YafD
MNKRVVKIINTSLKVLVFVLAAISLIALVLVIISKLDLLPRGSLLSGFEYIPSLWMFLFSLPITILLFVIRYRHTALIYISIFTLFILFLGDYSLSMFNSANNKLNNNDFVELNVMTYNVRYFSSGEDNINKFLNQSNMDIYLLTESLLTPEKQNNIKKNMPDYTIISDGGKDVSILSKYPVLSYNIVKLPTYSASLSGGNDIGELSKNGKYRSFIHAVIDVKGIPVNVLSLRLIAGRSKNNSLKEKLIWGGYLLKAQKKELGIFLDYIRKLNGPIILGGDLNTNASSSLVRRIRKVLDDAYFSDHIFGSFTFTTSFPFTRLDYLFHSRDVIAESSEIVKSYLSDHFPVTAKFLIPKSSAVAQQ